MRLFKFEKQRRLLNHFMLGADPEWVIEREGDRRNASDLGLKTASAFGADMNGRLLELRAYPSRWAVEVLAGIGDTLKWASRSIGGLHYSDKWLSGAYQFEDGLGGHVHFGRKTPIREIEAQALDVINHSLATLGIFESYLWNRRRVRTAQSGRGTYGADADTRPQVHGYEYRSFPSWLSSPQQAYVVLVLSKLAVHNPKRILAGADKHLNLTLEQLQELADYYAHLDDDALLLATILRREISVPEPSANFLPQWGVDLRLKYDPKGLPTLFPAVIPPSERSIRGMYDLLLNGSPLSQDLPDVTWKRVGLPERYVLPLKEHNTVRQYGIGEILEGLCTHKDVSLQLTPSEGKSLSLHPWYWNMVPRAERAHWQELFEAAGAPIKILSEKTFGQTVFLSASLPLRKDNPRLVTRFLTSGIFPVWKAFEVEEDTSALWHKAHEYKFKDLIFKGGSN